jgi:hypothetical protein
MNLSTVITSPCPKCGARPGQYCLVRDAVGGERSTHRPHEERVAMIQKLSEGSSKMSTGFGVDNFLATKAFE